MVDTYRIWVSGHLDNRWSDWLGGFAIHLQEDGTTLLVGPVDDQAALHGALNGIRDLGLPIMSIQGGSPDRKKREKVEAIVCRKCGSPDVLAPQEVDKPDVKDDEVLVRVQAASVNIVDRVQMTGTPYFMRALRVLFKLRRALTEAAGTFAVQTARVLGVKSFWV